MKKYLLLFLLLFSSTAYADYIPVWPIARGGTGNTSGNAATVSTINGLITNGTNITISGAGTSGSPYSIAGNASNLITVSIKTSNYSVLATDDGTYFTNTGASGSITFTQPTAAAGHNSCYFADTAQPIVVAADSGHTIRNNTSVTAASGNLTSSGTSGAFLCIVAINSTEWIVKNISGSWTVN